MSAPVLRLGRDSLGTLDAVSSREWLVTNGLGSYAAGTLAGPGTRRYHGLLVASLRPPLERTVLVAKLDCVARQGDHVVALGTNEYADGTIDPHGHRQLQSFRLEEQVPVWTWLVGSTLLEQRVWMVHGENRTCIGWRLVRGERPVELEFAPLCTWRDYHWQLRGRRDPRLEYDGTGVTVTAFPGAAPYRIAVDSGTCEPRLDWHWGLRRRAESERGLDDLEDLFVPATLRARVTPESHCVVTLDTGRVAAAPGHATFTAETRRQRRLLQVAAPCDPRLAPLVLAADQFLVERRDGAGGARGRSVIAGYPWFADWGRDTMIALPGLTLATGRVDDAAQILRTFALHVSEGMLPNRFPDDGEAPEYNTADATLWYFVAIDACLRRRADPALRRDLYPVLREILDWHLRGTRYGIRVDAADGLLRIGEPGVQLTWMDARVGDRVITPRDGKPVEINALWFNALRILESLAEAEGDTGTRARCAELAARVEGNFALRFWYEAGGHLYDVVDSDGLRADASLRPNQIFAVSLPHSPLNEAQARAVVESCERELWTPVGLRSLSPHDPRYVGRYGGAPHERDAVYHQGTVWSWLLGPFALAHYRVHHDADAARALLSGLFDHLREACVGQISEIFDGDAPFAPRGCFAQAWSVAETLRAWSEIHECESSENAAATPRRRA
jgi:predicted glycogen debranching enzyme